MELQLFEDKMMEFPPSKKTKTKTKKKHQFFLLFPLLAFMTHTIN